MSNQRNLDNITEEIEKLHAVEKEAENIGKLQTESGSMAKSVAVSSEDTVVQSKEVQNMVEQMQKLIENTLNQANQIVEETERQKEVTGEVEISFRQVNDVSKNLLSIREPQENIKTV